MGRLTAGAALAALMALTTGACGGSKSHAERNVTAPSGLYGTVKRGPLRPVCIRGKKCYGPAKSATLAFLRRGKVFARVQTNAKGSYRIGLPPGRYSVRAKVGIGGLTPTAARVPKDGFARLDFVIDTGIR